MNQKSEQTGRSTELVFILDRSGSMAGLETDTIGGFNSMLAKQQALPGECRITTVLFDNRYQLLHDRLDIRAVRPMTQEEYFVGGSTALLDAIGQTIQKIVQVQRNSAPEHRADSVLFVIITDGMENASRFFTADRVRSMIELETNEYGWEFVFLGANIDAVETAADFGIRPDRAQNYHADSAGVQQNYEVLSDAIQTVRESAAMPADWSAKIQDDYVKRGGRGKP